MSSSPVDQLRTTSDPTVADSFALNVTAEPSGAEPDSTEAVATTSSSTIVPIALAVPSSTSLEGLEMVILNVSSPSSSESFRVETEMMASVEPDRIATLPPDPL